MIDPGDSGIDLRVLEGFIEVLPGLDELGVFPDWFILEVRTRSDKHLFHVSKVRGVIRPLVPEDSRKTFISIPLLHLSRLVEYGKISNWQEALDEGAIRVE